MSAWSGLGVDGQLSQAAIPSPSPSVLYLPDPMTLTFQVSMKPPPLTATGQLLGWPLEGAPIVDTGVHALETAFGSREPPEA
jgi:hypothetical protein